MAVLTLMMLVQAGCKPTQYILNGFVDDRISAKFTLTQGTVLVLVDDPNHLMGDPSLPSVIAGWANQGIEQNVSKTKVIPVAKLAELMQKTGEKFAQLPVNQVGRDLGADQVVYVLVESVGMEGQPGVYHPSVQARVNVIDVITGQRIYPAGAGQTSPTEASQRVASRGEIVQAKLSYSASDQGSLGVSTVLMRALSQELGKNIGKLFYRHHPERVPGYMDE